MPKLPYFPFYPGDWLKDTALQSCSPEARGVWIDIVCYMFEAEKRGILRSKTKIFDRKTLTKMVSGCSLKMIDELISAGVLFVSEREKVFYSKRIIRDEIKRRRGKRRVKRHREALRNAGCNACVTPSVTPNEYESVIETRVISLEKNKNKKKKKLESRCPHQDIISLYHEILPMLKPVKVWNGKDRDHLKARWREEKERQNLTWWRTLFTNICNMKFLVGKSEAGWRANLGWIVRPSNLAKILNGAYEHTEKTEEERWFV